MAQEPEKKHSPLPWRILETKVPGYERYISVVHGEATNLCVCQITGAGSLNPKVLEEARANAQLIVRAVNNFDALVEALSNAVCESCYVRIGNNSETAKPFIGGCSKCNPARAALSAAKE